MASYFLTKLLSYIATFLHSYFLTFLEVTQLLVKGRCLSTPPAPGCMSRRLIRLLLLGGATRRLALLWGLGTGRTWRAAPSSTPPARTRST